MGRNKIYPNICGIYMVYLNLNLFYIGASRNIHRRFVQHKNGGFIVNKKYLKFLKLKILKECPEHELEYWEQYYLSDLKPKLNTFKFSGLSGNSACLARKMARYDMSKDPEMHKDLLSFEKEIKDINALPINLINPFYNELTNKARLEMISFSYKTNNYHYE